MPRRPRLFVEGLPLHIVQRGSARRPIFEDEADYQQFVDLAVDAAQRYGLWVHAWALMPNQVHLLATPARADTATRALQLIGNRYVQGFNRRHRRSGTLWSGRYRASLVDSDGFLLACMRYIESDPVRAGLVSMPEAWPWSSHPANAYGQPDLLTRQHPIYRRLGADPSARCIAYRGLFDEDDDASGEHIIRRAVMGGWPMGDDQFLRRMEAATGLRCTISEPGKPARPAVQGRAS
jgi:putative transposase